MTGFQPRISGIGSDHPSKLPMGYSIIVCQSLFLKNWAIPGLFYHLFSVFSNQHYNFYNNICETCPTSIWRWDSNPRPLGRESPPTTTRPEDNLITALDAYLTRELPILRL